MYYIVFDLEFNHRSIPAEKEYALSCPFEIIQIGAVKLDGAFQEISTFNKLIKPEIYPDLHPFIQKMTGISQEDLALAKSFREIYTEWIDFIASPEEVIFCVWGASDMKELFRNVNFHHCSTLPISKRYINLQSHATQYLSSVKKTQISLSNAVSLLDIPVKNQFHDAFHDALYTLEIFKKLYNLNMEPKLYKYEKSHFSRNRIISSTTLDEGKLFSQFEKMLHREISDHEKSMIKLAYLMGKTNQFQIKKRPTKK